MATQASNPTQDRYRARKPRHLPGTFDPVVSYPGPRPRREDDPILVERDDGKILTPWSAHMGQYLLSLNSAPCYNRVVGYVIRRGPGMVGAGTRKMAAVKVHQWDVPDATAELEAEVAAEVEDGWEAVIAPMVLPNPSEKIDDGLRKAYFYCSNRVEFELDLDAYMAAVKAHMGD